MDTTSGSILLSAAVFVGLVLCIEAGFRLGRRQGARNPERSYEGLGAIEAAVFALMGLLLAFSLAGATGRLDSRRALIAKEANAIGTAYLRLDLLPLPDQPALRQLFRTYLDARLAAFEKIADPVASGKELERAAELQKQIWSASVAASHGSLDRDAELLLVPAINDMIDVTTERAIALSTHIPAPIVQLLVVMALLSGVFAGFSMAKRASRSWVHILMYAAVLAITLYVVLDIEYPRSGLIRLDAADQALYDLRASIR